MLDRQKDQATPELEIESFAALSQDQVKDIMKDGMSMATSASSVNWEFTQITDCCCGYTEISASE